MEISELREQVEQFETQKFDRIIKLCNSPIEELFVGKLYSYFLTLGCPIRLITSSVNEFTITDNGLESVYYHTNENGLRIKIDNPNEYADPFTGEPERLCGFRFNCGDVYYEIYPQYPIFNQEQLRYADFVVKVYDSKFNNLQDFVIECDGFRWHNTREQLERDNHRSRFLTLNGYKILRYTGREINRVDDLFIIKFENTIYQSIFKKESNLYRLMMY